MTLEEQEDEKFRRYLMEIITKARSKMLADIAEGPVHCGHCNDEFLVEAEERGPGGCPTFESCPALNEPWHVKR